MSGYWIDPGQLTVWDELNQLARAARFAEEGFDHWDIFDRDLQPVRDREDDHDHDRDLVSGVPQTNNRMEGSA